MPGNIAAANPTGVFPRIVASSFTEEIRLEALSNTYADGSSERQALALTPRHYFHLTIPQTLAQWQGLWNFYKAHRGLPFYVYNPCETVPPFSYDASGADPVGRYIMVFDSPWSETTAMTRGQIGLSLREVA